MEVDEDSHADRDVPCELGRYEKLACGIRPHEKSPAGHALPQVVLRVNPDSGMPGAPPFEL